MKKRAVAVLLVVMAMVSLVACGSSKVDGTWESTSAKVAGKEVKWADMGTAVAGKKTTLTFDGDKVTGEVMGQKAEGTFKLDGDTVTINDGEKDRLTLKLEGDRLALTQSGVTIYFEKK